MIILSGQTDNLQLSLDGSATFQMQSVACWRDSSFVTGRTVVVSNNTSDVNIVPAPNEGAQRLIDYLTVYNADIDTHTVTIVLNADGSKYILFRGLLAAGEKIEYTDKSGFQVFSISGAMKVAQTLGTNNAAVASMTTIVSTQNTVNNNASANTLADVVGLAFPVVAGESYYFEAMIMYTAQATTTGSRWTINGPANPTYLSYNSEYPLTATTQTVNYASAYQIPAASNASSLTAGNVAWISGIIKASNNGVVQVQFASEVANSAITALAGSFIRYQRLT